MGYIAGIYCWDILLEIVKRKNKKLKKKKYLVIQLKDTSNAFLHLLLGKSEFNQFVR